MQNQVFHIIIPTANVGFKIVEMAGWVGKVFIVPRASLRDLKERNEANNPAIYFLFGENDESTAQKLYIGETETFFNRLTDHDLNKDFWNTAVIFIGGLDKAKVKYLEFLANREAAIVARFDLENNTTPKVNKLAEFDEISTRDYFEKVKYILAVLGYPVFEDVDKSIKGKKVYTLKSEGAEAKAQLLDDGSLNVLKGSTARIRETESFFGWSLIARKRFLEDGTFIKKEDGISYLYTRDVLFKSPTAAAATTMGRPVNGWTAWKDEKGNTLDENLRK